MSIITKYVGIIILYTIPMLSYSEPHQYKASYSFTLKGVEFANSEHEMIYNQKNDEWCINTMSYTVGVFSLKEDTRTEKSCFHYNKTTDNKADSIPMLSGYLKFKTYYYERKRSRKAEMVTTKKIDNQLESFINKKMIKYDKSSKLDRLTAQIFGYALGKLNVNDKGRERKYIFQNMGDNKIKTIFGDTNVRIVKKNILDSKRSSLTYYSTDNNYVPVMIEQYRLDKLMFRATLENYEN